MVAKFQTQPKDRTPHPQFAAVFRYFISPFLGALLISTSDFDAGCYRKPGMVGRSGVAELWKVEVS